MVENNPLSEPRGRASCVNPCAGARDVSFPMPGPGAAPLGSQRAGTVKSPDYEAATRAHGACSG